MKKYLFMFMVLFMATLTISAKGNNKRVIVTTTPEMHCKSCEDKIMGNLRFVKGVKIIQTSVAQQTVTITYDSTKCTYKDIEKAFKKIKYSIKEVDPKSLPSCCSGEAKADKHDCGKAEKECHKASKQECAKDEKSECCKEKKSECSKNKQEGCCKSMQEGCKNKQGCDKKDCKNK